MDAKPQRPRAWRVRDENLPPTSIAPTKSIHQRNKSTPALSTLLQVGANKMPTKRTVFADVSNTAGTRSDHHPAKDDLILHAKATNNVLSVKPSTLAMKENASSLAPLPEITKPSALLRPAQRPLSSIAQKAPTASTAVADIIATAASKNALAESNVQMGKPGRTLSKRQTMIFKENVPVDVATNIMPLIAYSDASSASIQAPIASEVLDVLQKAVKDTSAKQEGVALPQDEAPGAKTAIEPVEVISAKDVLALKAAEVVPDLDFPVPRSYSELIPLNIPNESCAIQQLDFPTSLLPENLEPLLDLPPSVVELIETHNEKFARHSLNPPSAEPEEYWDEEEEEEYYDADGYTTARSVRSRGDTTGAVTVVMEPRITAKVERELVTAKLYVESIKTPEDVEDEAWDTSMVAEYGDEIFTYMHDLENRMKPNPHYMDSQTEIQWSMRAVLMDWLVQVHHRFTLLPETLFLSVNYVDRFLSCKVVSLGKLQLVGATAIFVAAKYEEINCPSVQEIIFMVDGGYTMDEILKAERFMLTMLQFELGWPGPMSFLRRISKADDYDLETRTLAKYFLEVTIMDERFVAAAPSFTAAGAHCLARLMLKKGDWGLAHVHYSGYTYKQIYTLVSTILECCEDPRKHHSAVYDKYSDKRYKRASLYVETEIQKGFSLPQPSRESSGYSQSFRRK